MSALSRHTPPEKPVFVTVAALIIGVIVQPILGLDLLYDVAALWFLAARWMQYYAAAQEGAAHVPSPAPAVPPSAPAGKPVPPPASALDYALKGSAAEKAGDYLMARQFYTLGVEMKDPYAMSCLGWMYMDGKGGAKDLCVAAQWFERAIAHGDKQYAPVYINVAGTRYRIGMDVPKNDAEAIRLYRIAAGCNHADAQENLGDIYRYGRGVTQSLPLARHWYGLAAAQGSASAQENLAEMDKEARQQSDSSGPTGHGRMTRAGALEILDLKEGATPAQIKAAYLRLMQQVHPDKGGSNFFAKQLNEAREYLLK